MGSLWRWNFSSNFVKRFPNFVETGVGLAEGVMYAHQCGWKSPISIERDPTYARRAAIRTLFSPIKIVQADSGEFLRHIPGLNTFFWLDAHYPGHGFGPSQGLMAEPDKDIRMPLRREMATLTKWAGHCAILIDDLRYYSDDFGWGDGPMPPEQNTLPPEDRNLDFLEPFKEHSSVEIFVEDAGYALIVPHGCPRPTILR